MLKTLLIWIAAVTLSILSGAATIGAISKNTAPRLVFSFILANGFSAQTAAVRQTKAFVAKNQRTFPDQVDPSVYTLALQAFESEPVTPGAIAVIALSRTGEYRRDLMEKAFQLSRRQQLATGWLIMDSGARNDLPAILKFYDTTLRTSRASADIIIPMMANALANDSFVEPFAEIMSKNPPWASGFWAHLVATPAALANAANLRELLYNTDEPEDIYQDPALINALAYNHQFEKTEQLYALLNRPAEGNDLVRNGQFTSGSKYPPLDWQLFSNGEYGASIDQGRLVLSAISSSGGLFARQLVKLPSGLLTLRLELTEALPSDSKLFLELSCAADIQNKPLAARIPLSGNLVARDISNSGSPCRYYWLDITGRSADRGDGFDVSISSISLRSKGSD